MKDIFNIASLARLSKTELMALLANYQVKLSNRDRESQYSKQNSRD